MKRISVYAAMAAAVLQLNAQSMVTYVDYINNVREKNVEYIVEKYNISIAEANAQAAKIMPDPELSLSYENNQDWNIKMGQSYSAELGYSFELGGKRGARMAVAKSEQQLSEQLVADYFRNLRADATLCYLEALKQKQLVLLSGLTYRSMQDLSYADSLRYKAGEISEVNAMQSRLEASTMFSEYLQAEAGYKNILSDLILFQGGGNSIDSVSGNLPLLIRIYNLDDMIKLAQGNRADLRAAILSKELSAANLRLAKANRAIDLGINLGFAHNTRALNEEAPSPKHNTISAGISIPLKFSNINKGEVLAAKFSQKQAEAQYEAVLLQIRNEVEQSYNNYVSACLQAELYKRGSLTDASAILDKKKYSYLKGETSLLDVLDAQRTFNGVYKDYYEALYNVSASLVELCRASGIWEIDL